MTLSLGSLFSGLTRASSWFDCTGSKKRVRDSERFLLSIDIEMESEDSRIEGE